MSIPALYLIISLRATFPPGMSSAQVYAMIIIILSFIGWPAWRGIRGMTLVFARATILSWRARHSVNAY